MSPSLAATLVLGAYLLGSVSFSVVVVKLMQGLDVRTVGSGNAGATNVLRAAGKKAGAAVLALDAPLAVVSGAAVAVVVGHVFPVFFGFRGGKGVATAAGALGTLAPSAMALGLVVFLAVVAWQRYVSLGSIVTAASFPLLVWISLRIRGSESGAPWLLLASGAIAILIVTKHSRNLQRLRRGTEPRLGGGRGR
jgi:glycerol-3-phosphate acyltransferase PlsY